VSGLGRVLEQALTDVGHGDFSILSLIVGHHGFLFSWQVEQ
jgi:hypothetical protein